MSVNGVLGQTLDGNYIQRLSPVATREEQIAALNSIIDRLNGMLKSQIFSDGTNKRMLIGYQKDGWGAGKDFGMKVSIAGVDVTQASDTQLLFKMDLATWYLYDPTTSKNYFQMGILPDGTGGFVIAKSGIDLSTAF